MKLGKKRTMGTLAAAISLGGLGLAATGCAGGTKTVKAEEKSCGGASCSGKSDSAEKSCGAKSDTAPESGDEASGEAAEKGAEHSCGAGSCG